MSTTRRALHAEETQLQCIRENSINGFWNPPCSYLQQMHKQASEDRDGMGNGNCVKKSTDL